mgnify:CR=1 FL=1
MPHIAIGMLPGCGPEQKKCLSRKLREVLAAELGIDKVIVSVSIEDIDLSQWEQFMDRIPDEAIMIPEEKCEDEKYKKDPCCCC